MILKRTEHGEVEFSIDVKIRSASTPTLTVSRWLSEEEEKHLFRKVGELEGVLGQEFKVILRPTIPNH
jgi:hypothetical protein